MAGWLVIGKPNLSPASGEVDSQSRFCLWTIIQLGDDLRDVKPASQPARKSLLWRLLLKDSREWQRRQIKNDRDARSNQGMGQNDCCPCQRDERCRIDWIDFSLLFCYFSLMTVVSSAVLQKWCCGFRTFTTCWVGDCRNWNERKSWPTSL